MELKSTNKKKLYFFKIKSFNFIIFILQLSNIILEECPKHIPFLQNGICKKECDGAIYNSNECEISNSIIKNKYPNDVILVGLESLRYTNFITFSNGDILFQTSSFPSNKIRIFYGLKRNGRPYFKYSNNTETPFLNIETKNNQGKYESGNAIFIKEEEEYFISFGRVDSYSELFNYKKDIIISNNSQTLFGFENHNFRSNYILVGKNTYILSGLTKSGSFIYPKIIKFSLYWDSSDNLYSNIIQTISINSKTENIGSCFRFENNKIIICFYAIKYEDYFSITAYSFELTKINETLYNCKKKSDSFYYSIFFRENAGVFVYYKNSYNYPVIFFKKYDNNSNSFDNYFSDISEINLDKYNLNKDYLKNDIVKISDNKIALFSTSNDLDILYIIIIFFFKRGNNSNSIKIYYYSIEIYKLFNYKLYDDIKMHLFDKFLILSYSFCTEDFCDGHDGNNFYYSTLMIIGYPNNTDSNFDLISYLQSNNNNSINNIILDLSENITIDNNIFGYIYDGIQIQNISKSGYIYLKSTELGVEIEMNKTVNKSEKYKIEFRGNIYNISFCKLEYSYIVTEPEFEEYEEYPIYIDNISNYTKDHFNQQRQKYIGKTIYLNIFLNEDLTINCKNISCSLCFANNFTCITYNPYPVIITTIPETTEIINNKIYNGEIIKEYLNITKEELNIKKIINEKEIGKNYEIRGKDFTLKIKPTNSSVFYDSTYVDFYECEQIIRKNLSISNTSILTFLQLEIDNDDSKSLINQVEYLTYNNQKEILDLSLCKDINIQIHYAIKDNINLDKQSISSFKDIGIDIFDIQDKFFNDICNPYSDSNNDIILQDRINYIFQNYSLCDEGCT